MKRPPTHLYFSECGQHLEAHEMTKDEFSWEDLKWYFTSENIPQHLYIYQIIQQNTIC